MNYLTIILWTLGFMAGLFDTPGATTVGFVLWSIPAALGCADACQNISNARRDAAHGNSKEE